MSSITNRAVAFVFVIDGIAKFTCPSRSYGAILAAEQERAMQDKESHGKTVEQLIANFESHLEQGLTQQEANRRLATHDANELTERPRPGWFSPLWGQSTTAS